MALKPLFPFQRAQYAQVFPLKPTPFCKLFAGLKSTNESATSLLFSYRTLVLSSPPCFLVHLFFYLKLSGRSGKSCLLSSPVLSCYNESPDTRFSRATTRLMSWPDGERCLHPPQYLVVALLLSLVFPLLFFRTGGVLSHRTLMSLDFHRGTCASSSRSLCSLLSTLQRIQPSVKFLSL